MPDDYYSDREAGPRPRDVQEIGPTAWGGIIALIDSQIETGAFGLDYPGRYCSDGPAVTGTDREAFRLALQGEIPDLEWPLRNVLMNRDPYDRGEPKPYAPPTVVILDLVEFCFAHVARPGQGSFHSFFEHHHLTFDREAGQEAFRVQVNRILARNGLAYELRGDGRVERLAPPTLGEVLRSALFRTGDGTLDDLLEKARAKFLNPDPDTRHEGLEKLWDAWERLKSLENAGDKKLSVAALLDKVASEPNLRAVLEAEAKELTKIGNNFQIRHTEVGKVPISDSAHVDYLFHRLFSLIFLALAKR